MAYSVTVEARIACLRFRMLITIMIFTVRKILTMLIKTNLFFIQIAFTRIVKTITGHFRILEVISAKGKAAEKPW